MVHKMRDEQKCWQLLGAIPLHLRDDTELGYFDLFQFNII